MSKCVVVLCVVLCNSRDGVCPRRFFTHCGVANPLRIYPPILSYVCAPNIPHLSCFFFFFFNFYNLSKSFHKFARPIFQGMVMRFLAEHLM